MKTWAGRYLLFLLIALSTGCRSYTAYLELDPIPPAPKRLTEAERREAGEIARLLVTDQGFIPHPNLTRLRQKSLASVESPYTVVSSYVPPRSMTGHRMSVSVVVRKSSDRFAILLRDLDSEGPTDLMLRIQRSLTAAYAERFPNRTIEIETTRWGPPGGI